MHRTNKKRNLKHLFVNNPQNFNLRKINSFRSFTHVRTKLKRLEKIRNAKHENLYNTASFMHLGFSLSLLFFTQNLHFFALTLHYVFSSTLIPAQL